MESDVEEGEIRESECLSPLSDDDAFEPLPPNPKRRRGTFRSPPPPPSPQYSRRGRRQGTSTSIWKTGDNKTFKLPNQNEYYNGYKNQNRRSNRTNSRDGNNRYRDGEEGGVSRSRTRTVRRCSKYLNSNGPLIPDSPASPDPEIEDINSQRGIAEIRSPSPVELYSQGQRNVNPISISVSNSAAITNRDEDVEVLSIIGRNDRIAELIVIDSTSSSDSESSVTGDEIDFADPPASPAQNPPLPASVSPEKEESSKNVVTPTPVTPPQQNIEPVATVSEGFWKPIPIIITRGAPAGDRNAPMISKTPPRVETEEEEDLEVLELRIKALEGLMNKLPDDQEAFERAHAVLITMESPTPEEQDLGDDNEKENENELELYLLRAKLLSDLAKKKKREEELQQKQQPSDLNSKTKPKTASKTYERRTSSHSHNASSNTKSSRHSASTSRRSSIGRDSDRRRSSRDTSSSSTKKPSRSSSTSNSKSKTETSTTDKSIPSKPNLLPKCPPPPSLSVSVSTDGKHRQVVEAAATIVPTAVVPPQEQGQTLTTLPPVPLPAPALTPVPIQQKLVALSQRSPAQKSPVKGKKWKIASPTKLVTNLSGLPQKLLNSPQLLSKTIQNERFAITRTVINPVAFKSKYRTIKTKKNNYHPSTTTKKPVLSPKKKVVPIVIPLRDNDESTDEEYEAESSSTQKVELAEEFHSSLDTFLKSVREKASKNGVGGNPFASAPNTPSKVLPVENTQAQKISPPAPQNCSVKSVKVPSPNTLQSPSPSPQLPSVVAPETNNVVEEKVENASKVKSNASPSPSNLSESGKSISVGSNEKNEIKEASNPVKVPVPVQTPQPVAVKVMVNSNPSLAPLELTPRPSPKKLDQSASVGVAASTSPKIPTVNSSEKLLKSPTKSPIASPARSDKSIASNSSSSSTGKQTAESLAEQVCRTRQELELREKLLRATFKKNEMKYKLTTTEKEFLTTRTSATSLLGSAIDKINQHNDKTKQTTAMEAQVEKLRKQLELAQRSLFLKKKEAESVHEDAVAAIHRAFDMRATSVVFSLQCKQLGSELNGDNYKIPTKGAGDMLQKFKEIYKLTTQSELQKGQINFKKLENEIIAAFSQRQQSAEVTKLRSSQPPSAADPPKKKEKSKKGKEKKGTLNAALTRHVHEIILLPANRSPGIFSVMLPSGVLMPPFYMPYKSPLICSPPSQFGEIICKFLLRSRCPINNCKLGHFDVSQSQASGK